MQDNQLRFAIFGECARNRRLSTPKSCSTAIQNYFLGLTASSTVSGNILSWSHAKRAAKSLNKMALINEPDFGRD
jgi:hypothetical protein